VYSTSLPPAAAAAAREALRIAQAEPWRRERARRLGDRARDGLVAAGFTVVASTGPIVPVILGDPDRTLIFSDQLRERGLLVPAIRPPTVPKGTSRLRVSVSAAHTDEEVNALVEAMIAYSPGIRSVQAPDDAPG
jgi:8-amino-7-oxononanoate synthase